MLKKVIGIVRKLDKLNRLVIPQEMCALLGITKKMPVEITMVGDEVRIKKFWTFEHLLSSVKTFWSTADYFQSSYCEDTPEYNKLLLFKAKLEEAEQILETD